MDKHQDIKEFKWLIKNFLNSNTVYTLYEYFNYNKKELSCNYNIHPMYRMSEYTKIPSKYV